MIQPHEYLEPTPLWISDTYLGSIVYRYMSLKAYIGIKPYYFASSTLKKQAKNVSKNPLTSTSIVDGYMKYLYGCFIIK